MIRLIPFKANHLLELPKEILASQKFTMSVESYAQIVQLPGRAWTAFDGEKPIGCGGIFDLWQGVGEAWAVFTPELLKHPFFLHRVAKHLIWRLMLQNKYHRIQMNIVDGFEAGIKWAVALGFRPEGLLHAYTPDKTTFRRYALWQ